MVYYYYIKFQLKLLNVTQYDFMAFMDLEKAYDMIDKDEMWQMPRVHGVIIIIIIIIIIKKGQQCKAGRE